MTDLKDPKKAAPDNLTVIYLLPGEVKVQEPSSLAREINITIKGVVYSSTKATWAGLAREIMKHIQLETV